MNQDTYMDFMMGKHVNFYIIILFTLLSGFKVEAIYKQPDHVKAAKELTYVFARQVEKEFNVSCMGTGGGMPHDVETIHVSFISYEVGTIEKAREFIVKTTEKFLKLINEDAKIRSYLREYPFKANRAEITIMYAQKEDNSARNDGSIVHAFQVKNHIYYYIEDSKGERIEVKDELYDDALKIVLENSKKETNI